ncbi:MAG: glycosyltransferase family 4 protein [Cyanobacteria bacterium J06623_5]
MNVLHLNTWGGIGGAFITSDRLHRALRQAGIESAYAYGRALNGSDGYLQGLAHYHKLDQRQNLAELGLTKISRKVGLNDITRLSTFRLPQHPFFQAATVLNFHNLHSDYFSYLALPKLTTLKPAVWTLHDMWSVTGHCAYSYHCTRWQTGCGNCPALAEEPMVARDATSLEWRLKAWAYGHAKLKIVAPSRWLKQQAAQGLLSRFDIHHIPYGIDTQLYRPLDPQQCRAMLGISPGKRVLMFGAQSVINTRKGGDLLFEALKELPSDIKRDTALLTFGSGNSQQLKTLGMETIELGYVSSDRLKAMLYSAADIFVFPTRADNLPLVLQESLACGTPIVSFSVGGVPDMVRPGITGLLAKPADAADLREKILQLLADSTSRNRMRDRCREIALAEYTIELQRDRYIELYEQLLKD